MHVHLYFSKLSFYNLIFEMLRTQMLNSVSQFSLVLILLILGLSKRRISVEAATLITIFLGVLAGCSWITINGSYLTSGGGIPPIELNPSQVEVVSILFFRASVLLLLGSVLSNLKLFTFAHKQLVIKIASKSSESIYSKRVFFSLSFILIVFVFMNLNEILSRESYLFVSAGSVSGAIRYLIPLIGIVSAWMTIRSANKFLHFGNYITCILIEFSAASRSLGILLMLFFVFWSSNTLSKIYFFARISIGIYLGGIGISQALFLRSQENHGLLPHFEQLMENGISGSTIGIVVGTFLVIIPVTFFGLQVPTPSNYILTSVNPLPGRFTNWYEISGTLLLNPWTPTGSIAQLHNLGVFQESLIWLSLGFILGMLGKFSSRSGTPLIVSLISVALVLSASLQFLQYSLRAGMRFIYVDILFLLLVRYHFRKNIST